MSVKVGEKAPNFILRDTDKSEVSLQDYQGKNVVLLFFPLAFSSVCTAEMCHVKDDYGAYKGLDASIIGISVDSLYVLRRFKEDHDLNFTLLSDFNKTVSRAYGAFYEDFGLGMKGVSKRAAFVIDREGVIRYAEVMDKVANFPDFESVKETLSRLT